MQQVRAKKALGQHFLVDLNIAKKIVDAVSYENIRTMVEIGPGTGVLTKHLVQLDMDFKAVELDSESVSYLKKMFPGRDFIIEGDFLKIDLSRFEAPFSVIGNFPYYISSQIFFRILDVKEQVSEVVCMVQKEVAERIAAPHGNKVYGILSVLLQAYFDIEYLFTVHEHCFSPPPKVKSAVIKLKRNSRMGLGCDEGLFRQVVKTSFNQRRKTLRNSLRSVCGSEDCSAEVFGKRPEQLSVDQFVELTSLIEKMKLNR